jgi:L-cysteate sulfo-lyase
MPFEHAISRFHKIPRLSLGMYPTPIEEMPRLRAALGGNAPRLFVKHDDYTGPGFGGNKVRKLEYILARAKSSGVDTVLTIGNLRSNHARVTAALAARLGLECHLILNGKAYDTPASTWLGELFGATVHAVSASQIRVPTMAHIAEGLQNQGRKTMEIPLGGSDSLGAMGYVSAAEEIALDGRLFDAIFHCSSSGGTHAGMDAGLQLFQLPSRLIGVSPDGTSDEICASVAQIREGIADTLGEDPSLFQRPLEVSDGFIGEGYGIPTPASTEALQLVARIEGIVLDPAYTAKTMASLISRVRSGEFARDQSVLFLHTGGQLSLFSAREDLK